MNLQPSLTGKRISLRPLRIEDFDDLYFAASDPEIWEQHPSSDRYKKDIFIKFFNQAIESKGAFAVIDPVTDYIIGSTRFYDYDPVKRQVIIGYTFLAKEYWGLNYNREMKHLLLKHAFEYVDKVIFEVGKTNIRSQKAMEKLSAQIINEKTLDQTSHLIYQIKKSDFNPLL
ncbi:MAG: GNAT family N-acetyltransferase [Bdellovibrionales bacterium]|nr:GNAT family N-acetyltransferase [Bdellovibrionales bacterium]